MQTLIRRCIDRASTKHRPASSRVLAFRLAIHMTKGDDWHAIETLYSKLSSTKLSSSKLSIQNILVRVKQIYFKRLSKTLTEFITDSRDLQRYTSAYLSLIQRKFISFI